VVTVVNGGYFADASPNGTARDIGYAFGCSSSTMIVNGAVVDDCACIGYTGTTNGTDYTYLYINNVEGRNIRKTIHQTEDTSVGRMYWKYSNVDAEVDGTGIWVGDGDLSREESSYVAMPNDGNRVHGSFHQCSFKGATYCFISTTSCFGQLKFSLCDIETNGFLWDSKNIGSGAAGDKLTRGIIFDRCAIEDLSSETGAYTTTVSSTVYTYIDLSTSTITLNSTRDIESSTITSPGTFIEKYEFPRDDANIETITVAKALKPESEKIQAIIASGATRVVNMVRPDKYKFHQTKLVNTGATYDITVRDYTNVTDYATLAPGESAILFNDGSEDYVLKSA
jgi:hypothetical protein